MRRFSRASSPPFGVAASSGGHVAASGLARAEASLRGVDIGSVAGSGPNGRVVAADVAGAPSSGGYRSAVQMATPSAKELAKKKKVALESISGTGPFGRVTKDDVLIFLGEKPESAKKAEAKAQKEAAKAPKAKEAPKEVPAGVVAMDGMQKAVVKNMEASLEVPVFRVSRTIVMDSFDDLYQKLKPKGVSVSALLAKAVANVLERHPLINSAYDPSGAVKYNEDINIAMAVALDGGLITPTLRKANELDVFSLARDWKELVGKAREKRLSPEEYNSGTFTISNLGMFGVTQFDAILPPGTGAIMAVGATIPTAVPQKNGFFAVQKQMTVTLTGDHRQIYGSHAAEFLKDLADYIENNSDDLVMG